MQRFYIVSENIVSFENTISVQESVQIVYMHLVQICFHFLLFNIVYMLG
jgi:hypothetical protein